MTCNCPGRDKTPRQYSYYCNIENHRKLASGKVDAFSAKRNDKE